MSMVEYEASTEETPLPALNTESENPLRNMGQSDRCPDTENDWEDAEGTLTMRGVIACNLRHHSDIGLKKALWPPPEGPNVSKNQGGPINQDRDKVSISFQAQPSHPPVVDLLIMAASFGSCPMRIGIWEGRNA